MLSKSFLPILILPLISACTPYSSPSTEVDENVIGSPVKPQSAVIKADGTYQNTMVIFDETVKVVHKFDLDTMKKQYSVPVRFPEKKHNLYYADSGQYFLDLSEGHISIYREDGSVTHDPIELVGQPVSVATNFNKNLIVIYDSLQNVGILKMSENGEVQKVLVKGGLVNSGGTILCGDLLENGHLILAVREPSAASDKLVLIDLDKSLEIQNWSIQKVITTNLTGTSWIARIPGQSFKVMYRALGEIGIYDLGLDSNSKISFSGEYLLKYSKLPTPHILVQRSVSSNGTINQYLVAVYPDGGELKQRQLVKKADGILESYLDLDKDSWRIVEIRNSYVDVTWDLNFRRNEDRKMKSYRFSDLMAVGLVQMPKDTKIQLSDKYAFALYPSELGYATRTSVKGDEVVEAKGFNIQHMRD